MHADVVGRRVPAHAFERVLGRDAAHGARDDDGYLALEGQELGALRADDRIAVARER